MKKVLDKNQGYILLSKVAKIHNGDSSSEVNIEPNLISALKYAPITSVDVEGIFSVYKQILSENFLIENIEKHIVASYNINAVATQ